MTSADRIGIAEATQLKLETERKDERHSESE